MFHVDCLITDSSLVKLFQRQKLIKRLSMDIPTMTDISMSSIAENCKQLESLILTSMPHVTDVSMEPIVQQCKNLKKIRINCTKAITDVGITAISQHCPQLEKLSFSRCPAISDISLQAITENCRNLTELRFEWMSGLRNPSLIADIARNNIRLKFNDIQTDDCGEGFDVDYDELWNITYERG